MTVPTSIRVCTSSQLSIATCLAAGVRSEWLRMLTFVPARGESWPTAAIPVDNPHCSCKLTRVRSSADVPADIMKLELRSSRMWEDVRGLARRNAVDTLTVTDEVAAVLPETLRQSVFDDVTAVVSVLGMLRESVGSCQQQV